MYQRQGSGKNTGAGETQGYSSRSVEGTQQKVWQCRSQSGAITQKSEEDDNVPQER